ncbi:serine/threonine protein phosphatase [Bacillus sp. FJAT-49705]|uniref:Serine/threonine protein phosphatase n=1 Tax=Cytobacillus citreus TaxID=2833586 RepID=A0ABS5NVK1_9BACI|nr:metallophosphoesterase family protein [Cytobacillus citreus]MBS4191865.1 serine/threonine protein phosphatase [Cytobacillus citreus]
MKRMLAISDIHGDLEKFEKLLELVKYDKDRDQLLLLGDFVDRGTHSRAVLDKVIQLRTEGAIALIGNHEKMMIDAFLDDPMNLKRWYYNGGINTLQNYGYEIEKDDSEYWYTTDEMPEPIQMNDDIRSHIEILKEFPYYYETDTHIFVHAGVHPDTPIESTEPQTLVWIREEFHNGYTGEKTVVFGHTPTNYLHESKDVYFGNNNIIGIDGGCAYGGRLCCLEVGSSQVFYVE